MQDRFWIHTLLSSSCWHRADMGMSKPLVRHRLDIGEYDFLHAMTMFFGIWLTVMDDIKHHLWTVASAVQLYRMLKKTRKMGMKKMKYTDSESILVCNTDDGLNVAISMLDRVVFLSESNPSLPSSCLIDYPRRLHFTCIHLSCTLTVLIFLVCYTKQSPKVFYVGQLQLQI